MRWNVAENVPKLAPSGVTGARIFLDAVEVRHVVAFDTAEGWVDVHCTDGRPGHPERPHIDPDNPDRACRVIRHGAVHLELRL